MAYLSSESMMKIYTRDYILLPGVLLLGFSALLLAGCMAGQAPVQPAVQAGPAKPQVAKHPARSAPARTPKQADEPERAAPGKQMGGARQGVTLNIRGVVSTFAGKAGQHGYTDSYGSRARFDAPKGITTDGFNLYVADLNNHTIRKIEIASGKVITLAGLAGKSGSNDGKGSAARFNRPYGMVADGNNLYVTDSNNHSIRQIDIDNGEVTTLAGKPGEVGYADGALKEARFFIPEGITADGENLYVSDTHNHSIRKIDLETGEVTTFAGLSGAPGFADDTGGKARFSYPKGITTDGHHLYVVDFGNHRVRKVPINSAAVVTLAGGEIAGDAPAPEQKGEPSRFNYPTGITTDGRYLYVVDTFNRTIRKVSLVNGAVSTIAGKADLEGSADGTAAEARFRDPVGITTDGSNLFVTDSNNHTIRRIH